MRQIFTSPYKHYFLAALVVFLVTAFFSEGYYHPDEHFQILEFANYKLGRSPAGDLPWEFNARIRPALQPSIVYLFVKALSAVGVHDPFTYTLLLRVISALLAWFVICKSCLLLLSQFTSAAARRLFILTSLFLWFIPAISVRFSSENYSGLAFLSALYLIITGLDKAGWRKWSGLGAAGLLLGLSFYFRFQIGFAIFGLGLWLVLIRKVEWKALLAIAVSGLLVTIVCTGIDHWFYGEWVCTPFNYFYSNIVEDKAASFGVSPWWSYFLLLFLLGVPLISLPLMLLFFTGIYRNRLSIFAWCLVPFLLAHFAVGHKELRFMFPVVFAFIYLAGLGLDYFFSKTRELRLLRIAITVATVVNLPLLFVRMITPAQKVVPYYRYIYRQVASSGRTLFTIEKDPYVVVNLQVNFYRPPQLKALTMANKEQLADSLAIARPESLLLLETNYTVANNFPNYTAESVYCLFPDWILHFNINNWVARSNIWDVKHLERVNK